MENLPEKFNQPVTPEILPPIAEKIRNRAAQASPKVKAKATERVDYWASLAKVGSDLNYEVEKEANEIRGDFEAMIKDPQHHYYEEFYKGWTPEDVRELYKVFYGESPDSKMTIEGDPQRKQIESK